MMTTSFDALLAAPLETLDNTLDDMFRIFSYSQAKEIMEINDWGTDYDPPYSKTLEAVIIPDRISSYDDMVAAGELLMRLTSYYASLNSLYAKAKIRVRTSTGEEKKLATGRREIIDIHISTIKQQYAALSRAVTIYMENIQELRMNISGSVK